MKDPARFWDRFASRYDRYEEKDAPIYEKIVEKTRKYLRKIDHILDFACGTGIVTNVIAGDVSKITAIDISSNMLDIARSKSKSLGIANIDYKQSGIFEEKLTGGNFDVVTGYYILHLLDDQEDVIKRIHCLLKHGGLFISVTPCLGESALLKTVLKLAGFFGLVPKTSAYKTSGLETLIKSCGFEIAEIECLHREGSQDFIAARKT